MFPRRFSPGCLLAVALVVSWLGVGVLGQEAAEAEGARIAELLAQLDSQAAVSRAQAAQALGEAKVAAAIPKLIEMLDDPDEDAQWKATVALAAIGKPSVPALIEALNLEKERPRWKAEAALKMIGADALDGLIEALEDRRVRVRQSTAYLLGEIGDPKAIDPLAAALADKDEDTRWKAATSLTKFGTRATLAVLRQLKAQSVEARRCAAWVFQQVKDTEAIPALVAALNDSDEQVRWKAAIALQKIGPPAADPLLTLLRSPTVREDRKKMLKWILEGIKDAKVQAALRDLEPKTAGGKKTARPRPRVLPEKVTLTVNSTPSRATVFVDDKYVGVTPLTVKDLAPGHHFVKLTKRDHLPWTKLVELLYPNEKIDARLVLKPKGLEKKNLDANPYSVRLEKEHYLPWETEVEVKAGQQVKVHGTLKSKVESWYLARLKENPNDVSCHTELAHYYMVQGDLQKAVGSIANAVAVVGRGADTSGYAGRLVQEIAKIWNQEFQFGGGLKLPEVRKALHAAIYQLWQRQKGSKRLAAFLAQVKKSAEVDFTRPLS